MFRMEKVCTGRKQCLQLGSGPDDVTPNELQAVGFVCKRRGGVPEPCDICNLSRINLSL
jgi:hypothetical protein